MKKHLSNFGNILFVSSVLAFVTGCATPRDPVEQQKVEVKFWQWFQAHEEKLYKAKYGRDSIFNELDQKIHDVSLNLTYEVSLQPSAKREFVISADGNKAAFPDVVSLADRAPKLNHWTVLKFRQRCPLAEMQCGNVHVKPDDIYFELEPDDDGFNLKLFIRDFEPTAQYFTVGFLCLDHALGEYVVETKLHDISFKPLTAEIAKKQKTISELAATIDGESKK